MEKEEGQKVNFSFYLDISKDFQNTEKVSKIARYRMLKNKQTNKQTNKQQYSSILFSSFYLNGHT